MAAMALGDASAADEARDRTLVIGKISTNPKKHYLYLKPIADYVVANMHDLGIDRVKVLMARDNRQMIRYLRSGRIDWVTETVFPAIEFEEQAGAEILALKWKKGVPTYHSVFFTRKESGVKTLADLVGRVIAFEDPGSTSSFLVPAAILADAGLRLERLETPRDAASADAVGYVFAKQEINMSTWVHKGLVDAGAFANQDWEKEDHLPRAFRAAMSIFHRSEPIPRALEIVRKDLRPDVKRRLKRLLLTAHEDPDAASALQAYQKTTRFEEIGVDVRAGIERIRKIKERLETAL
ncbi:phosphate/phosphite/phosphonate ABC transporter substrate-binding protein [Thiorhodococcus minor]|uniref:Phosphate/phosphite/phosphonate ABC transporter substrate-binding protein n=2 Tax=Thiorhodococcus minor TaxID=57489 RepID=A0A6M0K0W4_9GAMM|nr:phosphate/phosphite/phosphonate ABC transporter substrate-binding protein [Thiorhodococcus minor]